MKKLLIATFGLILANSQVTAQGEEINGGPVNVPTDGIIDGVFIQEHIPTKRMIPYEYVREADVVWSHRVFQYIDLREKINLNLYYPKDEVTEIEWVRDARRWSLWTIIRNHTMRADLRVFSPFNPENFGLGKWDGFQLKYPIDPEPGLDYFSDSAYRAELTSYISTLGPESDTPLSDEYGDDSMRQLPNGDWELVYPPRDTFWINSADIVQYRIKEDWFFDKERSVLDQRIIAIAPVVYDMTEINGKKSINGMKELFWLYFPHCRFVFNNYFVYNDKNDAQWMSFDDLFWKRRFNAVIYSESNAYNREIKSYQMGADALHESAKIKNKIRNIEHDVWSF